MNKKADFIEALKDREYQNRRNKMLLDNLERDEEKLKKKLIKLYKSEASKLDKQIAQYYAQYGKDNVIEYRSLLQTLSANERVLLIKDVDLFINKYPQFENIKAVRESIYKLDRLEGLRVSIEMQQMDFAESERELINDHLVDIYGKGVMDSLNRLGHGTNFNTFDRNVAKKFINEKWIDGKSLSYRIYENRTKVAKFITSEFRNGVIRGDTYKDMSKKLINKFSEVSSKQAMRLVRTEGTRVMNEATISTFENEFEEYRYSAIFDDRTSQICKALDGRVFKMKDRQAGVNFPPMHPNCRSSYDIEIPKDWLQQAFDKTIASGDVSDEYTTENSRILGIKNFGRVENDAKLLSKGDSLVKDKNVLYNKNISGALNPYGERAEKHAVRYYASVEKMATDVKRISNNTGFREVDIEKIKNYVFIDSHNLGNGKLEKFYPDYMMSQSWQRLIEGINIQPHDLILLDHEFYELTLVKNGLTQTKAHILASEIYNYSKGTSEFYANIKKYKD